VAFTHTLFPVYMGLLVWGGLVLREERVCALVPMFRTTAAPDRVSRVT
jgi:hypothetical protein